MCRRTLRSSSKEAATPKTGSDAAIMSRRSLTGLPSGSRMLYRLSVAVNSVNKSPTYEVNSGSSIPVCLW